MGLLFSDVFFKDMPDGATAVACGRVGDRKAPWVFVGGSCSIQGFNPDGFDEFWTVTGAQVLALALCDISGDGLPELLAGQEDCRIRVYTATGEMHAELALPDAVTGLCPLGGRMFAFILHGGTTGVYHGQKLLWKSKNKAQPVAVQAVKMAATDTMAHVAVAWADGTLEIYQPATGHVIFRDDFSAGLAGLALVRWLKLGGVGGGRCVFAVGADFFIFIFFFFFSLLVTIMTFCLQSDYRLDGNTLLLAVSVEGEVRGYLPVGMALANASATASAQAAPTADPAHERMLQELLQRKMVYQNCFFFFAYLRNV